MKTVLIEDEQLEIGIEFNKMSEGFKESETNFSKLKDEDKTRLFMKTLHTLEVVISVARENGVNIKLED